MTLERSATERNAQSRIVTLYEATASGTQVPVYRYWPVPVGALASGLSSKAKLLLGLIYRHAGRGGRLRGWGTRRLAGELGVSPRAIGRHRDALVEVGLIEIIPGAHREAPDVYQIQLLHPWMRMPVVHVPALAEHLSPAALLVYGWVAWKQGTGSPWRWAVSQVAEAVGLGERMVQKARAELEETGFVLCRRLQGRAHAWLLLDHAALGSVLIEGRGVLTAAPPEPSVAGGELSAAPPEPSAAQLTPTPTPPSDSSQESTPIWGGELSAAPSGRRSVVGGRRRRDRQEYDREAAKDAPLIGWD